MVLALLAAAGCGGAAPAALRASCSGLEAHGICWDARDGISLSRERVDRVYDAARVLWGVPGGDLAGWRVEIRQSPPVVDGQAFNGYTWSDERLIVVAPFARDCFEMSAILHELGHAWGFEEDDPRMSSEWPAIHAAMEASQWPGCRIQGGEEDDG
jgi:hypothetical protein